MTGGYLAATFVSGPWNGSIRSIEASRLHFEVMASPREKLGVYRKVPGIVDGGHTAFAWEPAE
jgi:hypothetical protein